ncbi:uncharacterized protein MELLADRAFT_89515 [Melampsora larici-populina 98AG31]|uniref:Uncharacterized protein n=1 Tax=Melampsora larici-populina (strain 98AG31 / pathotype 3-4-7) TaxID=747676 RepID=F4RTM6_MELLP|nr:uncharacterized protein MELLADRAFT_89515 [Melampsora larici-populina 98AG31]EGG04283.1 hypothetical protein MELLADRAFT_89515 [Melampsora larici-populina 98AG31]
MFCYQLPRFLRQRSRKVDFRSLALLLGLTIVLVGCKKDLRNDPKTIDELRRTSQRPVTSDEGMAVAQKIGAQCYLECSAKSGHGVREVFEHATWYALLAKKGGGRRTRGKVCNIL